MDHHTALKRVPLWFAWLIISGCAEFGPVNTKESDVLAPNVFFLKWTIIQLWNLHHYNLHTWKPECALSWAPWINTKELACLIFWPQMSFLINGSSYSFETCTILIGMPENLRVCWVWPCKYKGKWCFRLKCVFSEMDHHTALKLVPLQLACLKNLRVCWVWPCKYKRKWCFSPKCVFSINGSSYSFETCTIAIVHAWKPQGVLSFGPVNTKESDVLAPNVFSLKWIIIQLWNLYHCDWHAW